MKEQMNRAIELFRQKKIEEAEVAFLKIQANSTDLRPHALSYLINIAQHTKNFDLVLSRTNQLLAIEPENIWALLIQSHGRARKGNLIEQRRDLRKIMNLFSHKGLPISLEGFFFQLYRSIQYVAGNHERIQYFQTVIQVIQKSISKTPEKSFKLEIELAKSLLAIGDLEGFSTKVAHLDTVRNGTPKPSLYPLLNIHHKISHPNFPDFNAPKVFVVGLSRTATSSMNEALNLLGLHSIHWTNPLTGALINKSDFLLFDAFSDISVSCQFEWLYHAFPNSKFIFTTRPIESWVKSVRTHYKNNRNITEPFELNDKDATLRFGGEAGFIEYNLYAQFDSWERAFQNFEKRVFDFFTDKPAGRFLEFSVFNGDSWEKLCGFLGKEVPEMPFPNKNKGPQY